MSEWGPPSCGSSGTPETTLFLPPLQRVIDPATGVRVVSISEADACGAWFTDWDYGRDGESVDLAVQNTCWRAIGVTVKLSFLQADPSQIVSATYAADAAQVSPEQTVRWSPYVMNVLRAATNAWDQINVRHYVGQTDVVEYVVLEPGDKLLAVIGGQAAISRIFAAAIWH